MRILSIRQINLEFSDLYARTPIEIPRTPHARYPGVHQSDILKWIAVEKTGKMKAGERLEEEYPWRMAMGNMWEEFYFSCPVLKDSIWQPGEVVRDGIAVNPDGISYETFSILEETKCTECKACGTEADLLERFRSNWWVYEHQGRGYGYVYSPRIVRWSVLHYRGDWRGSGPVAMEYVVEFTDGEVEQTWQMERTWKSETERALGITHIEN